MLKKIAYFFTVLRGGGTRTKRETNAPNSSILTGECSGCSSSRFLRLGLCALDLVILFAF